ncbi:restriction system-associated AAA family ATPase [Maribacter sp. MJ134]|uniref:restriction system-associated AAA family ATPase n=1 Tax=Maribacter sp. MJ134 TaxID=2496865 RepID=UPI000F819F2B|nr:restriction system-associated AAA family ATPase [Maribacter sp. MJ134]AZQ59864.1 restriction system-associated AAA family ATPase [Maribacter sp. MJ134]
MRIRSIEILGNSFRSLKPNQRFEFNNSKDTKQLSTKIFAGLNGSGKSNFLELFSEVFYYLELYHLPSASEEDRLGKSFGFIIEYYLPYVSVQTGIHNQDEEQYLVRISKKLGEHPEFSLHFNKEKDSRRVDYTGPEGETKDILPKKVIAYTSGQNELLSNPYHKVRYHYFKQLEGDKQKGPNHNPMEKNTLFFMDYESNFSVFICNMLLAKKVNLDYYKNILAVEGLNNFRITLNLIDYKNKNVALGYRLQKELQSLKLCATTYYEEESKTGFISKVILDYKVNQATIEAFKFHFKNAFDLFKVFYEFDTLNLHTVPVMTRKLIMNAHKTLNLSDEMPKVDPSSLIFRIEKITVDKIIDRAENEIKEIFYKSLSDGEHQFSQVIGSVLMMEEPGCLFLFDEPNTHFNPMWRAKMISILNKITGVEFDSNKRVSRVRQQEVILTTHSPFVISDSFKENVYKFENGIFTNPELQTHGSSITFLLELIFNRDISISDFSNEKLIQLKESLQTKEDIARVKRSLLEFGESIEKFDVYSYLMEKEEEFNSDDDNLMPPPTNDLQLQ